MAEPSIWVVIAAYNEGQVLAETIRELLEYNSSYKLVVVDDGSTDNTSAIARNFPVHLLVHPLNLGQGAALATGIEYSFREGADIIVTFDADGQMRAEDIGPLVEAVAGEGLDVALGSRFLNAPASDMPTLRKIVLRLGTIFTRLTTGLNITDTHNGLRAFRAEALRKINITQNGMAHASEILSEIARHKLTYKEIPVAIRYTPYSRKKGQGVSNVINILFELFSRSGK